MKTPHISDAEWRVMRILWRDSPLTANEVIARLDDTQRSANTIRTLINRLAAKKVLGYTKEGRNHLYRPMVKEADCVRAESRSFLQRVYGGALKPMFAAFIEDEKLTPEEIEELKRILDDKRRG